MLACSPDCERIEYQSAEPRFALVRSEVDGDSIDAQATEDVCRCSDDDAASEPCLELLHYGGPRMELTKKYDADIADVSGTMLLEIREVSPELVEIDVTIDASATFSKRAGPDASDGPPETATLVLEGLSTTVTRRIVEGDCSSSSSGCGCKYGGWLPGK